MVTDVPFAHYIKVKVKKLIRSKKECYYVSLTQRISVTMKGSGPTDTALLRGTEAGGNLAWPLSQLSIFHQRNVSLKA